MDTKQIIHAFLNEKKIDAPYQIWLTGPENEDFFQIAGTVRNNLDIPVKLPYKEVPSIQYIQGNKTHVYFNFPNHYQIFVCFYKPLYLDSSDRQVLYHLLYPSYVEYAIKESEFKIGKIIESIRDATSSLDLEEVFSKILSNALEVIPNADIGTLWLFDTELNRLICKASVGNLLKGIRNMQFEDGEGPIGYTYQKGIPMLFRNTSELSNKEIRNLSQDNFRHWDETYDFDNKVKSVLSCPIKVGDRIECVMFFCQIKGRNPLTEDHLNILQGFSSQIGTAIRNARQYRDIKNLNQILIKRDDIHSRLFRLSAQNDGGGKVIQELSTMIGQPILFVDLLEEKCIPVSGKLPSNLSFKKINRIIQSQTNQSFYHVTKPNLNHFIYPIRSGNVVLGCLVFEAGKSLGPLEYMALEQGNAILALELVKKQNLVEFYYKKKRELFHSIIQARDQSVLEEIINEIGMKDKFHFVAATFQISNCPDPQELEAFIHRFITQIKNELSSFVDIVFGHHNKITLLVGLSSSSHLSAFENQFRKLVDDWSRNNKGEWIICGGMGTVYNRIDLVEKSFHEAKIALSYMVSRDRSGWIKYEDIGVNRLFIQQDGAEITRFLNDVFEPLKNTGVTLEQTILTYFECNQSASHTAKKMHIHINTLYQRLKKIENCLHISFENEKDVLQIQLACYLKGTLKSS